MEKSHTLADFRIMGRLNARERAVRECYTLIAALNKDVSPEVCYRLAETILTCLHKVEEAECVSKEKSGGAT